MTLASMSLLEIGAVIDKWADIMVADIMDLIQIDDNSDTDAARAARRAKRDRRKGLVSYFNCNKRRTPDNECAENGENGARVGLLFL